MLGGNALDATSTATSIRGDIVTDGPFAETKEALGGYYLIEAADLDQALAVAKLCPAPRGGVEVRPILDVTSQAAVTGEPTRPTTSAAPSPTPTGASGPTCSPRRRASPATSTSRRSASRRRTASRSAAWRRDGIPRNPAAWLTTTARRKALDVLRRDQTLRAKLPLLLEPEATPYAALEGEEESVLPDDRLRLVFTCCHPALAREAQVALTLRLVCGLTTTEIAQAFLVSEPTMAARVTRAKKKISAARIPFRVPAAAELPDRIDAVLTVVHLLFTTGHARPRR